MASIKIAVEVGAKTHVLNVPLPDAPTAGQVAAALEQAALVMADHAPQHLILAPDPT